MTELKLALSNHTLKPFCPSGSKRFNTMLFALAELLTILSIDPPEVEPLTALPEKNPSQVPTVAESPATGLASDPLIARAG